MKKTLLAIAGAVLLFTQAAQADQLQDIEKRGVLRVAVPQDFPPFGSVGTELQPQGYDIDMARYLASQMKLKLQLVPVTSANPTRILPIWHFFRPCPPATPQPIQMLRSMHRLLKRKSRKIFPDRRGAALSVTFVQI